MKGLSLRSGAPEETERVAAALVSFLRNGDVVLLSGDLGAGKTVFTRGLARAAGVAEPVTSPTFTLIHSYRTAIGLDLLHADVYRLETTGEIADLGLAELIEEHAFALVEWGERTAGALGPDHLLVTLSVPEQPGEAGPSARTLTVRPVGRSWEERWARLEHALRAAAPAIDE
ncbi:MAG: tRNA (adenosine(37)-N6)-threonylcarbamoyltransferase complex ATPase subunit type 1 TsaE, partial [Acidimicrobiaceae bacterium]|nr:tRNA (adenosine(37)-N6)-threonylcarbamoyltransferase complex ATPase subunit type 1 TsaE [Acidimicrobiaceae bacterium]